ncbi:MAG TPA: SIMPL domain-containing protein [Dehalococcoidales bacterium]
MKKGLLLVIGLVLVVSLLLVGCESQESSGSASGQELSVPQNLSVSLTGSSQQTGIWVSGTGEVTVTPDVAILTLGVEAQEKTVKEAQSEAASAMAAVVAALKTNGVADKDIQTQWYSISPVTKWVEETNEQITTGYSVTNMVTVKIRDISKAGTIIDAVAEAGGDLTRINSINFTVDDPTAYYNQAREQAMQDAKDKAEQMATLAGVTLGKPTYISESSSYIPTPYYLKDYAEGSSASTPISAGELDITLTVQVGYAIE